jgi:hypothetical protein
MGNENQITQLLGTWHSDPTDRAGVHSYGDVTLKFGPDGTLLYVVHQADKDQVIRLTFRVEPGFIVTDQPSQPRPEKTRYEFTQDGKLVLAFGGEKSCYIRVRE